MLDLMLPAVAAALVILSIHAYLGLHVIARGVIFVDLAFAQIAALGTTVGFLAGVEHGTLASLLFSLAFTSMGALIFSFTRMENSPVPQESIIGITYVVASATVILLAGLTAEGAEHVRETMTGALIWVDWPKIIGMAAVYALVGIFHYVFRKQFLRVSFAPDKATKIKSWDFLFYLSFGLVISFSVEVAGVLMVFSALVIPAVVAFLFTNRLTSALFIAWGAGTVAILTGIGGSFYWDLPTGPLLVCAFGAVLVAAGILRPLLGVKTGEHIIVASLEEDGP